jgi:hypothetical protein
MNTVSPLLDGGTIAGSLSGELKTHPLIVYPDVGVGVGVPVLVGVGVGVPVLVGVGVNV